MTPGAGVMKGASYWIKRLNLPRPAPLFTLSDEERFAVSDMLRREFDIPIAEAAKATWKIIAAVRETRQKN